MFSTYPFVSTVGGVTIIISRLGADLGQKVVVATPVHHKGADHDPDDDTCAGNNANDVDNMCDGTENERRMKACHFRLASERLCLYAWRKKLPECVPMFVDFSKVKDNVSIKTQECHASDVV